jgi:hypothetical protein
VLIDRYRSRYPAIGTVHLFWIWQLKKQYDGIGFLESAMTAIASRTRANRENARLSTGPRTPTGLTRSSQNALKVGLFSRLLVLPTLGESVEECDRFRAAVVTDLAPAGAVEAELADRLAVVLWRLRRVARYEAAAVTAAAGTLPPHPDAVAPVSAHPYYHPVPPDAPTAYRLGRKRDDLHFGRITLAQRRAEATLLDPGSDPDTRIDWLSPHRLLETGASELGWDPHSDPWPAALTSLGIEKGSISSTQWTLGQIQHVLDALADRAGRDRAEFLEAVRGRLRAGVEEYERAIANREREETELAAQLLREREVAAGALVYADDALVQRVARAEAHLSRELDRALALLAALRADRCPAANTVAAVGFVLSKRGSAGCSDPVPPADDQTR